MRIQCPYVSADEAGDEIFQVCFEKDLDAIDGDYVLIQRAWLEEDEGAFSPIYVETHDEKLIGHYSTIDAALTRNQLTLRLPPPVNETIDIEFTASEKNYREVQRMLGIILQKNLE